MDPSWIWKFSYKGRLRQNKLNLVEALYIIIARQGAPTKKNYSMNEQIELNIVLDKF